jgi:hypothetical protein
MFFRPKIRRIFSENGDCGKWWRIMGCSVVIAFFRVNGADYVNFAKNTAVGSALAIAESG